MPDAFTVIAPSGGDDAPAINAAFATDKSVVLQAQEYRIDSRLTVPVNCSLQGQGISITKIRKNFSGDMVRLETSARLGNLSLNGVEPFTGGCITIPNDAAYQVIENISAWAKDCVLKFEGPDAGNNIVVNNFSFTCWPNTQIYAVQFTPPYTTAGGNRTFRDGRFSGSYGFDLSGVGWTMIDNCSMGGIKFTVDTKTVHISNCRVGHNPQIELRGSNIVWHANNPAHSVVLTNQLTDSDIWEDPNYIINQAGPTVRVIS